MSLFKNACLKYTDKIHTHRHTRVGLTTPTLFHLFLTEDCLQKGFRCLHLTPMRSLPVPVRGRVEKRRPPPHLGHPQRPGQHLGDPLAVTPSAVHIPSRTGDEWHLWHVCAGVCIGRKGQWPPCGLRMRNGLGSREQFVREE